MEVIGGGKRRGKRKRKRRGKSENGKKKKTRFGRLYCWLININTYFQKNKSQILIHNHIKGLFD